MKRVLILAPFCTFRQHTRDSRHVLLSQLFYEHGYNVNLYTSIYDHNAKLFLKLNHRNYPFTIHRLFELPYTQNISILRAFSHSLFQLICAFSFTANVIIHSDQIRLIIVTYPLAPLCLYTVFLSRLFRIPAIVDVQDTWPEIFLPSFIKYLGRLSVISTFVQWFIRFYSKLYRNLIYYFASYVLSVSHSYLKYFQFQILSQPKPSSVLYLGSDLNSCHLAAQAYNESTDRPFQFLVFGSTSYSYNYQYLINSFDLFLRTFNKDIRLLFVGSGPQTCYLQEISTCRSYLTVKEAITFDSLLPIISAADFLINPLSSHASQSISNRLSDYVASGKPILTPLWPPEFHQYDYPYYTYDLNDNESLLRLLHQLIYDHQPKLFSKDSTLSDLMNRNLSYNSFVENILYSHFL